MAKKLERSSTDSKIAGVCGGIAEYLRVDSTIVRVIFLILLIPGGLPGIVPYIILWIVMPKHDPAARTDVIDV